MYFLCVFQHLSIQSLLRWVQGSFSTRVHGHQLKVENGSDYSANTPPLLVWYLPGHPGTCKTPEIDVSRQADFIREPIERPRSRGCRFLIFFKRIKMSGLFTYSISGSICTRVHGLPLHIEHGLQNSASTPPYTSLVPSRPPWNL